MKLILLTIIACGGAPIRLVYRQCGTLNSYYTIPCTSPKVYSAFHPSGVGKWIPAAAGKAKAGMAHSDCGGTCGCAGKTVKSLENTCHTWALLRWWFTTRLFVVNHHDSLRRGAIWAISSVCTFTLPFTFYHTYIGSVTAAVNGSFASWRLYVKILPYNGGKNGKNRIPG